MFKCSMGPACAAVLVGVAFVASVMTGARGAVTAQEDFNDFSLGGAFEESSPGGWSFSSGAAQHVGGVRSFIRTVATDYNTVDFQFEVTYTVQGGGGLDVPAIAFVGIGNGTPGEFFGEPDQAVYTRHWPTEAEAGLLNLSRTSGDESSSGASPDEETPMGNPGDGRHRARVTKAGGLLTLSLDEDYVSGPFVADLTTTRNLADSPGSSRQTAGCSSGPWRRRRRSTTSRSRSSPNPRRWASCWAAAPCSWPAGDGH